MELIGGMGSDVMCVIDSYDCIFREMHKVAMNSDISLSEKSARRLGDVYRLLNSDGMRGMILMPTKDQLSFDNIKNGKEIEVINGMSENIIVLRSKQKPKKVTLIGNNGIGINFLIKNEMRGDLRKDMRMMEATTYIIRLIKMYRFNVTLQSYSVIPLSEVSGIIEFVSNMCTLRILVNDELKKINPKIEIETRIDISKYSQAVSERDRHAENILFNIKTGEVMHVDFDCLFGKGTSLLIPELVPFRLTQNLICNLGICGISIDGPYYSVSLKFLKLLHKKHLKLTAILMSFVFDPLIEWDNNNNNCQKVLQIVQDKLQGILNVIIPNLEINNKYTNNNHQHDFKTSEMIAEPLEPKQQLQQLLNAATTPIHLSKMFVGWAPWL